MIPVRNLYFMLLYSWGYFRGSDVREMGADESPDLPNLLANVLNNKTHRLLRKGLDQGYVGTIEETRSPRGKLRLDEIAKRQTLLSGVAVCEVDERTPNTLHNRILRETLLRLSSCQNVEIALRHQLQATARRMRDISRISLTSGLFHRVQLSRNTMQYGLLMRICEMAFHTLMPDEHGEGSRFLSIQDDQVRMSALFEDFLRKFYNQELLDYQAASETMRWEATAEAAVDMAHLPVMRTDITIRSKEQLVIVDAKYYREPMAKGPYGERVRAAHLYQLMTYLAHARLREPNLELAGMLIYPSDGKTMDLAYTLLGTRVRVATVNLDDDWKAIHQQLIEIFAKVASCS